MTEHFSQPISEPGGNLRHPVGSEGGEKLIKVMSKAHNILEFTPRAANAIDFSEISDHWFYYDSQERRKMPEKVSNP